VPTAAPASTPPGGTGGPQPSETIPVAQTGPTSADLIRDAVDAGTIDETTGLLYRIYAMFGDSRLPAEFVTEAWHEDGAAIADAVFQLETLPEEVATEIRPFLARPTSAESVFFQPEPVGRSGGGSVPAVIPAALWQIGNPFGPGDFVCESDGWGHIDGGTGLTGGPAWKVWAHCNDAQATAQTVTVAGFLDLLYDAVVRLMGPHKPDSAGPAEAGDGALDVYLVNQCVARSGRCMGSSFPALDVGAIAYAQPTSCESGAAAKCSGFVVFKRSFVGANTGGTLAHELFHVLQFAHNTKGISVGGEWNWFTDASAKWAEHFFYPPTRPETVHDWFRTYQKTAASLTDVANANAYASYVWPYFMQQKGSEQAIAAAWREIEGKVGHRAVTAAIDRQLPFATNFREFAVRAWNKPLDPKPDPITTHFWDLDTRMPQVPPSGAKIQLQETLRANPRGTPPREVPTILPPVSERYAVFEVDDPVQQVIVDFSGLRPSGVLDVSALLYIVDKGWEKRDLPVGETKFCRSDPDDNVLSLILVLDNHSFVDADVIEGEWQFESLREPCSGWDVEISWTDVYDGVADTFLFNGVVDTVEDNPLGDEIYMTGTGTASGSRAGYYACNPGFDVVPSGTVPAFFQGVIVGDKITISAFADVDTVLSGVQTAPFEVDLFGGTVTYGNPPSPGASPSGSPSPSPTLYGDLCPRFHYGTMTATPISIDVAPEP
jgi:hypothetical protein